MQYIVTMGVVGVGLIALSYVGLPYILSLEYEMRTSGMVSEGQTTAPVGDARDVIHHVPIPVPLRAIYMTSCVVGTPHFRDNLVDLIQSTALNAVIIDIKDYSGTISFPPTHEAWKPAWQHARCGATDMKEFIAQLHAKEIFVIGRITVFQDPFHTEKYPEHAVKKASDGSIWHDHKGLSFIDVGAREYWDHLLALSRDAYNIGFDEINFDYVRYPSDGNMEDIAFPQSVLTGNHLDKQAHLEEFFTYLRRVLSDEATFAGVRHENTGRASNTPWMSVDLFGMTTTNKHDLSIGQVLERALPHFDFVAPMVYPSHYPQEYLGLGDPNEHPYEIVYHAMLHGVERALASTTTLEGFTHVRMGTTTPAVYAKTPYPPERLRTWIQDFDYGGEYDAVDVRAQIQASIDAGVHSWMVWSPSNIYTREALP